MLTRILFSFLAIFGLLVAGAFFLPKTVEVERTAFIAAPQAEIFPYLNNLRAFNEWSPWAARDPRTVYTFTGPEEGVGASMLWHSEDPGVGAGRQEIVESIGQDRLLVALDFGDRGWALSSYELDDRGNGTQVTWGFETDLGYNPLNRYMGLFFEHWVGSDYELGLKNLKIIAERKVAALTYVPETVDIRPVASIEGPRGERLADDMGADEDWLSAGPALIVRHARSDFADDMGADDDWLAAGIVSANPRYAADNDVLDADEKPVIKARASIPGSGTFRLEIGSGVPLQHRRSMADAFWVLPSIQTEADLDAAIAAERQAVSFGRAYADDMGEWDGTPAATHTGSLADSYWVLPAIQSESDLDAELAADKAALVADGKVIRLEVPVLHLGRPAPHYSDDMGSEFE